MKKYELITNISQIKRNSLIFGDHPDKIKYLYYLYDFFSLKENHDDFEVRYKYMICFNYLKNFKFRHGSYSYNLSPGEQESAILILHKNRSYIVAK